MSAIVSKLLRERAIHGFPFPCRAGEGLGMGAHE